MMIVMKVILMMMMTMTDTIMIMLHDNYDELQHFNLLNLVIGSLCLLSGLHVTTLSGRVGCALLSCNLDNLYLLTLHAQKFNN